ncbi:NifB/NifX family molybdenum-iron cluster-binding protein [Desulfosporosinus shakirovi]|uniref:NifB/NifX family molybdenum-iron cluster-binding protein n=1 Tax=Desulfosporosinus shakirovi TaxID=2885154 RepID=UPI001E52BE0C|nr:NifB/NifX family molybdenum-iron cluster-binding protein [Desulfosporosinus sp. SRJS8]MCB8815010.1 hypothetical protein [Desulfosporosinus sp. SRJS8]
MIVAIASIGREISPHFGQSNGCTVFYIKNQQITAEKFIENPLMKLEGGLFGQQVRTNTGDCSCRFFAQFLLHEIKIDVLVTGHIGGTASQLFRQRGINVIAGVKGKIMDYLQEYVKREDNLRRVSSQ